MRATLKFLAVVALLIAFVFAAVAVGALDDNPGGCVYSTGDCGDPAPGNNPASPIP